MRPARSSSAATPPTPPNSAAYSKSVSSTDGLRVLPFKPTLFAAFFAAELIDLIWVQPVTVVYTPPDGGESRFYGWWGDMDFGTHLLKTLAAKPQGRIDVTWHAPLKVADFTDRKVLARAAEDAVRSAHTPSLDLKDGH